MECPFLVRYNDGYWIHDFYDADFYLQRSSFDCLEEGTGNNVKFEVGVWCIVTQRHYLKKIVMKVTYSYITSTQHNCQINA